MKWSSAFNYYEKVLKRIEWLYNYLVNNLYQFSCIYFVSPYVIKTQLAVQENYNKDSNCTF